MTYGRVADGANASANLLCGIHDDGKGSYVLLYDLYHLEAVDKATSYVMSSGGEGGQVPFPGTPYRVEFGFGMGKVAQLKVDGILKNSIRPGERPAGSSS